MDSHISLGYPEHHDESELSYPTAVVPSGLPSLSSSMAILPQYSHAGRMEPEFINSAPQAFADDEDDRPSIAIGKTVRILGYHPREGTYRTPIVVRLVFRRDYLPSKARVSLRVKMGNIPICTEIEGIQAANGELGEWRLHIAAPDPRELDIVGLEVPLIVQAFDIHAGVMTDDVCIGPFKFWTLTSAEEVRTGGPGPDYFGVLPQSYGMSEYAQSRPPYSRNTSIGEESASQPDEGSFSSSYPGEAPASALGLTHMTEAAHEGSVRRRAQLAIDVPPPHSTLDVSRSDGDTESPSTAKSFLGQTPGEDTYQVSLGFLADLNSMTKNWTPEEVNDKRRIVEFFCVRTRGRIDVTFAPIPVEKARDLSKNIVSCIWWDGMEEFIITSVDTINLLERLVGTKFTTEEKNRIRRNLQGFKPATVSKSQPESEPFFRTLMEFPPPRPRNIEKDVKAFAWSKLPSMLEKVVSKYWFTSSSSESETDDTPSKIRILRESDNISTESPNVSAQPLSASETLSSAPPSQREVESMCGDIIESGSYAPVPPSSQTQSEEYYSGTFTNEHHLGYAQESQGSLNSMYGGPDTLMEISEESAGGLHSISVAHTRVSGGPMNACPESVVIPAPSSTYTHHTGANQMAGEVVHSDMQYMTHTSY
ncbi:transcriptional regulator Medusa [Rhizoctonia solani]|uniref:Transcriptional regulator Medusa n=1 Tax=Rhizoctonia solani TaxID=456999 RepID=A0A8H8NWP0_9AGAM|nr:transcriptional regulator Medusa [Rhizoctonia solani]QRW21481.1 transcriptional regulator Medusa [Rhizoctonia solani]